MKRRPETHPASGDAPQAVRLLNEFRQLFDSEFDYVCQCLARLGVAEADLKDVSQEVFVAVHARFEDCDRTRPMRPWLFAFAYRKAANYRRRAQGREIPTALDGLPTADDCLPRARDAELENFAARQLVQAGLEGLSMAQRGALIMHDMDGFSAPEIAEALQVPTNTVYSHLREARKRFRRAIEELQTRGSRQ